MVRISKQDRRRAVSPRKIHISTNKTGPKKDNLPQGYKEHSNALDGELAKQCFIPKIS